MKQSSNYNWTLLNLTPGMASALHTPEDISCYQELPAVGYSLVFVLWEHSNKLLILLFCAITAYLLLISFVS